MPDISMCFGEGCIKRDDCYRFIASPSEFRQSYLAKAPIQNGECEYFVEVVDGEFVKRKDDV